MNTKHNNNIRINEPYVPSDKSISANQIDTIGPLLAEIYKIVKEMKKQNEEILNRIRREN